ncbi:MAG: radical SAM protein, partial [Planctomycetota bacterium]
VVKDAMPSKQILRLLFWESTIKCNLTCAHCRRIESDEQAHTDMSTAQGKAMIEQLAELGKGQPMMPVLVFSGGEPLCREDLFETIARKIKESGIARVSVSLDGATAEVHNKLRQLEGSFESALEGIGHLRDEGVPFQINITLTKHNAHQLEDVYELAKSIGAVAVHIFMLVPVGCGQSLADTDMLSPEQYEQKMVDICKLDSLGELQMKVTCGPHYERVIRQQGLYKSRIKAGHGGGSVPGGGHGGASRGCLAGLGVLFVGHQGDVFPCGYLPVNCGNVLRDRLSDIWYKSRDLARMREGSELEGKCGVCGYRQICGGCRGRAYASGGNYMAEEPFCAYVPPEVNG